MTHPIQHPTDAVRLDDPEALRDLPKLWDSLLERYPSGLAPVFLTEGVPAWLMLSVDVHQQVLQDPDTFARDVDWWRDFHNGVVPANSPLRAIYTRRRNVWNMDGSDHRYYREITVRALASISQSQVVAHIDEVVDRVIDTFCAEGRADLVARYTSIVPLLVLCRLYGMEAQEGVAVCTAQRRVWDGAEDALHVHAQLQRRMGDLAARRRLEPGQDLVSEFIAAGLDDEEIRDHLTFITAAAHEPAAHTIAHALRLLLDRKSRLVQLHSGRTVREAINTSLWHSPPMHTLVGRFATRDTELGGFRVAAGDCLVQGFGPAQQLLRRDERLDTETNRSYLIFGLGPHGCPSVGRDLALTIAETAVQRLDRRLPDMVLQDDEWQGGSSTLLSDVESLRVAFTPTDRLYEGVPWQLTASASTPETSTETRPRTLSMRLGQWLRWIWQG
ncbi:cytochrome P450 family protein [Streptomonospora litoralis]|uniref:Cytochrome P450-SU1 n=1 Tax=Streptomonospora litoralis TaxID=2498135 RepID=A0A4P6Q1H9_9ACTN|nr:cytochrome P450 [Streptomonospora litoralis]QBI53081.1 Cytochrome P450-SU1 [Streptomonospora litoralis]